eukprot:756447-Hanusia_phi.AAC.3
MEEGRSEQRREQRKCHDEMGKDEIKGEETARKGMEGWEGGAHKIRSDGLSKILKSTKLTQYMSCNASQDQQKL